MAVKISFHYKLDLHQRSEWVRFWEQCRHSHPRQHFLFGKVERAKGRIPIYTVGEVDGNIVCIGLFSIRPLFFGKRFSLEAVCLRGPSFDDTHHAHEFLLQVIDQFRTLNVGCIRIAPYWPLPEAGEVLQVLTDIGFYPYRDCNDYYSTGLVDVQQSDDEIFRSFSKSTRREIRRAERQGVTIRPASDSNDAMAFFQHLSQMCHERGIIPVPSGEFKATFQHILRNEQMGGFLIASQGKEFLGGLWIERSQLVAITPRYVVATEPLRHLSNLSIGPILWWSGMKWAKEKGCSWLDVDGYKDDADPSDERYLVYQFKKRFNPEEVHILDQHICILNPAIYSLCKVHRFMQRGWYFTKRLPYKIKKRAAIQKLIHSQKHTSSD